MANEEIWKPVPGYEGKYEVSNIGNIKSAKTGKLLKPQNSGNGYFKVRLSRNGQVFGAWVHRLVAAAFIPNENNLPVVDHKDGNKKNNAVDNLEWCTQKENSSRAFEKGFTPKAPVFHGELHPNHVLSEKQVSEIKALYATKAYSQRQLAKRYGISQKTVNMIVTNRAWKEIQA